VHLYRFKKSELLKLVKFFQKIGQNNCLIFQVKIKANLNLSFFFFFFCLKQFLRKYEF